MPTVAASATIRKPLAQIMEIMPCPKCGQELPFRLRDDVQHYGDVICPTHGHSWISKPSELKTPRRKGNREFRETAPLHMQGYCWICLRNCEFLKSLRPMVPMEGHHIIEVQDGGGDDRDNLLIACKECHSTIHHIRQSFNRYGVFIND